MEIFTIGHSTLPIDELCSWFLRVNDRLKLDDFPGEESVKEFMDDLRHAVSVEEKRSALSNLWWTCFKRYDYETRLNDIELSALKKSIREYIAKKQPPART